MRGVNTMAASISRYQVANIIAINIFIAEIRAEKFIATGDEEQMNMEYAKAEALRGLVDDLGIDKKYFSSLIDSLSQVDAS